MVDPITVGAIRSAHCLALPRSGLVDTLRQLPGIVKGEFSPSRLLGDTVSVAIPPARRRLQAEEQT
jgi:hypothetical protein